MAGNSKKSKKLKRSHAVDRLSGLPDSILHYILSFLLDTKSVVQTSLLSRRWRCLWKHVHVLNFVQKSFPNSSSFEKHINRVLSLRFHRIPVSSITFDICGEKWGGAMETFEKILKYADSHGGDLHHLSFFNDTWQFFKIGEVADVITASHHNESLKTLKLGRCTLEREFDLHFKLLTTVELFKCRLQPYPARELFDPFANLPCLNHLKLLHCRLYYYGPRFMISGLQLLHLEIECPSFYGEYEVIAPKLKSLYWCGVGIDGYLPKLNLPALDHANINLLWRIPYGNAALKENRAFMNFFCGLQNAEYLQLHFYKADHSYGEQQHYFPLNAIKELIGPEAPPFTRLKTLRIQCAGQQKLPNIDYEVIRYFFEGSRSTEAKQLQLELVNEKQW